MLRTIKSKISMIYMQLVFMIAIVGVVAVLSLYSLTHAINGLMTDNYKSINVISNMVEAVEGQDSAILVFISGNTQKGIDMFSQKQDLFEKSYEVEQNNITEASEKEYVDIINVHYYKYLDSFRALQVIGKDKSLTKTNNYYETKILKEYDTIKSALQELKRINELAMFDGKRDATANSQHYLYIVLALSAIAAAGGWFGSRYFANKVLNPLQELTQSIRMIKSTNTNIQKINQLNTYINKQDEIGELAREFSNMTKRLKEYDESNLGLIMTERNKSVAIVRSIKDPLVVLDNEFHILLMNDACEKFFAVKENKAISRHLLEVIDNKDAFKHINSIYEQENGFSEKVITIDRNEETYYFNIVVAKVCDSNAKINGLVVLFQNVTSFKELEKNKTDFIASISHEIKTPLTSILMGTSLLREGNLGELNLKQRDILDTIQEEGERINLLVKDLIELSRLEAGKAVFNLVPRAIEDIIFAAVRCNFELALQKDVRLTCEINGDMPVVNVDIEKISWVLNNLITNAIKHSEAEDEIVVKAYVQDNNLYVSVKDTGIGIPTEYLEKIFDKFFQIKGSDSEMSGTGLGLSIARDIVKFHEGNIWCESKLGEGANFIIALPVYPKS